MWRHNHCVAALLAAAAFGLSGCGVQPLYGTTVGGSSLGAAMETVDVTPIPGRVGQKVRNELIFATTGGGGREAKKTYQLDIVVKQSIIKELVKISGDATGEVLEINASYKLKDGSGKVVLQGRAVSRAAYQRFDQIFTNVRAQYDAENRAARTVADTIKVRLAAFLHQDA
jgi:LPS-assembly lipoprotein